MLLLAAHTSTKRESQSPQRSRLARGAAWGAAATVTMTIPMILGMATGVAPMPEPIPKALLSLLINGPAPLVLGLAGLSHLAYGSLWGAALARTSAHVTFWKAIGLSVFLWFVMQVVVLPLIGWGLFGAAVTPMIAVATLLLHLVYGSVLGWGMDR